MRRKIIYAEVTINDKHEPTIAPFTPDKKPGKGPKVALIANTHRAAIRVAELPTRGRWLTQGARWQLVQANFPIGPLLNEDTHIFDGSIFKNNAQRRSFFMVAIPKAIAEPIAEMALKQWGSAHRLTRLDTIEHVLFNHYTRNGKILLDDSDKSSQWIIFPQDSGFRVLFIDDGLPHSAHYISNEPDMRESELTWVWEIAKPKHVIILSRMPEDEVASDKAWEGSWLHGFISGLGEVEVVDENLHCLSQLK